MTAPTTTTIAPPPSPPPTTTTTTLSEKPHCTTPPTRDDHHHNYPTSLASSPSTISLPPCARQKSSEIWQTLGYLTFVNPFLCFLNLLYTLLTLVFRFRRIPQNLSPPLRLHLRFLYCGRDGEEESGTAARLVMMHLMSPVVAVPLSFAAACVGFAWVYTEVLLGERNESGGMEYRSYLWVRGRWEGYVLWPLKHKTKDIEE